MEQKQRAIVLRMNDAKNELVNCINNIMQVYGLSPYLLEPMCRDLYEQIKIAAKNELAQAMANEEQGGAE